MKPRMLVTREAKSIYITVEVDDKTWKKRYEQDSWATKEANIIGEKIDRGEDVLEHIIKRRYRQIYA